MDVIERVIYLAVGGFIGFILGFIVARLREIKEEVDQVLDMKKSNAGRPRNDQGFMRYPMIADVMYILVLSLTLWAAFASQTNSDEVEKTQREQAAQQKIIQNLTACNQEYLAKTIQALNERTTFSTDTARANIDLQKAQKRFLGILLEIPPPSDERSDEAFREYYKVLDRFVLLYLKTAEKTLQYSYPTTQELAECIAEDEE